jgi:hypothetical protein
MLKRKAVVLLVVLAALGVTVPTFAIQRLNQPLTYAAPVYLKIYEDTDWLNGSGDYWNYNGTLSGGVTYKFELIVPWNADFDIKIYDENGNLVASGTNGTGDDEMVYITPAWTGPFTIRVFSYSSNGWYTLKVYRKL